MKPFFYLLFFYPISLFVLALVLKYIMRKFNFSNVIILSSIFIISNLLIYYLIKSGAHPIKYLQEGLYLFTGLRLRQWLRILFIPNFFTIMYIAVLWIGFRIPKLLRENEYKERRTII